VSQFENFKPSDNFRACFTLDYDKEIVDPNQLANLIVDIATGEIEDAISEKKRHQSQLQLGNPKGAAIRARNLAAISNHVWSLAEVAAIAE
jgi:hypothetical protein